MKKEIKGLSLDQFIKRCEQLERCAFCGADKPYEVAQCEKCGGPETRELMP
jgi:hypothetical protein